MADLTFNVIDVETANPDCATICQIGIVHVRNGNIAEQWQSLVNPECWFHPVNVQIHGISEDAVGQSPTIAELHEELCVRLNGSVLVSHTAFDRVACNRAMSRQGLGLLQVRWVDSARIARQAWPGRRGGRGYGLRNMAEDLGISFRHHDALEDARAAAEIVLQACNASNGDLAGWLSRR